MCNKLIIEAVQRIIPPPQDTRKDRSLDVEGITTEVLVLAVSVGIAYPENGFLDDLFPSSILKVEHQGRCVFCFSIERIIDCDFGAANVDRRLGQV
jgi:hypothetical protein